MTKLELREHRKTAEKAGKFKPAMIALIETVEYWQQKARAGLPLTEQGHKPTEEAEEPLPTKQFIDRWHDEYLEVMGTQYVATKGKDFGNVKALLRQIPDIDHLMKVARAAWKRPTEFHCKAAVSINGFCTRYNDIVAELRTIKQNGNGSHGGPVRVNL